MTGTQPNSRHSCRYKIHPKTSILTDVEVFDPSVQVAMKKKVRVKEPVRLHLHAGRLEKFDHGSFGNTLAPVHLFTWYSGILNCDHQGQW